MVREFLNRSDEAILEYLEQAKKVDEEKPLGDGGWRSVQQITAFTGLSEGTVRSRCERLHMDTVYLAKHKAGKSTLYRRR